MKKLTTDQQKQVDELIAKFHAENEAPRFFLSTGEEVVFVRKPDRNFFYVTVSCKEDIQTVIKNIPPTKDTFVLEGSTKSFPVEYPFAITLNNNVRDITTATLRYIHDDLTIFLDFPVDLISSFTQRDERIISESEHHYFVGLSHDRLRRTKVSCNRFSGVYNTIRWYGGNETLLDKTRLSEITETLLK